jgi:TctA family transporter
MDLLSNLALGFSVALSLTNLMYCTIGVVVGTAIGVLPGVGPLVTIAVLLPLTFGLPPDSAMIMLAGIYYGAAYGGSTTAILVNLPGEQGAAVTVIDGYQMALQGRAGPALAIAAIGSFVAGCFGTFLIAVLALPLTQVALEFGAPEFTSLIVLALVATAVLVHGSMLKGIAVALFGVLVGLAGIDSYPGSLMSKSELQLPTGLMLIGPPPAAGRSLVPDPQSGPVGPGGRCGARGRSGGRRGESAHPWSTDRTVIMIGPCLRASTTSSS